MIAVRYRGQSYCARTGIRWQSATNLDFSVLDEFRLNVVLTLGMDLRTYTEPRGVSSRLARAVGVNRVVISQWATGVRPVPEDRAPSVESASGFQVPVEVLCPHTRWYRVSHPDWPHGKPLIDKTPLVPLAIVYPIAPPEEHPPAPASVAPQHAVA